MFRCKCRFIYPGIAAVAICSAIHANIALALEGGFRVYNLINDVPADKLQGHSFSGQVYTLTANKPGGYNSIFAGSVNGSIGAGGGGNATITDSAITMPWSEAVNVPQFSIGGPQGNVTFETNARNAPFRRVIVRDGNGEFNTGHYAAPPNEDWVIATAGSFSPLSAAIFSNRKSLQYHATRTEMFIDFNPTVTIDGVDFPLDPSVLAEVMGVHHFNWYQTVEDPPLPLGWSAVVAASGFPFYFHPADQPRVDPVVANLPDIYDPIYILENPTEHQRRRVEYKTIVPDGFPFYYNENVEHPVYRPFHDEPTMDDKFNPNGLYKTYRTELVGVTTDRQMIRTGLGVTWRSNVLVDSDKGEIVIDYSEPDDYEPVVLSGSIADVQPFYAVPEPSSLFHVLCTAGMTLSAMRRRSIFFASH